MKTMEKNFEEYYNKIKTLQLLVKKMDSVRMYKKSMTNTFREKDLTPTNKIDLSDFNKVIYINEESKYVEIEGSTTFETLVNETLQKKLMPPVVPELKTITVGGAIVGLGIESSSFKYGLVHNNVTEVDVILPSGEIITCSKNSNNDLFEALPNSLGSLCYITRIRMNLIPVKKYVHIKKRWYNSYETLCNDMGKICSEKNKDFVDGVLFSMDSGVLIVAEMTDELDQHQLSDYKVTNIYYKSLLPGNSENDYLTIKDYIWRWDSDWFWCNESIPLIQNYYVRKYILGEKYLRSDIYKYIIYKLDWFINFFGYTKNKESIIQDIMIPIENVPKYLDFLYENILSGENSAHYVWLCPHYNYSSTFVPSINNKLYIDIAQWGLFKSNSQDKWYLNKLLEGITFKLNGFKSLYSTVHYDKNTFDERYNGKEYNALKNKYDPNNKIISMYEKCTSK